MSEERKALAKYRSEQAAEAMESAQILFKSGKLRSSVGRSYYAMFYAVQALLAVEGPATSKHAGVISAFDRDYVKSGKFEKEQSIWLHEAFDLRQRADYKEMFDVTPERAESVLRHAERFTALIHNYLEKKA